MTKILTMLLIVLSAALAAPISAMSLIRDAEIERALRQLARPVLQAAGMGPNRVRILVIHDSLSLIHISEPTRPY